MLLSPRNTRNRCALVDYRFMQSVARAGDLIKRFRLE